MKLTIVTINRNNAEGLQRTLCSVLEQQCTAFEHVVVDGASTDDSVQVVEQYVAEATKRGIVVRWVSEPDSGIYNAMNKGIGMASGEYIQILNSGDTLAAPTVVEQMFEALEQKGFPEILYGNMIKVSSDGRVLGKSCEVPYSFLQFYVSTLNHDCAYIRRALFTEYGLYDESLKIVSDWKWYLQAIGLGRVRPVYVDIDVTYFDASGISETQLALRNEERSKVLSEVLPPALAADMQRHAFEMTQMNRLRRYPICYKFVWFMERCLFKWEKWTHKFRS